MSNSSGEQPPRREGASAESTSIRGVGTKEDSVSIEGLPKAHTRLFMFRHAAKAGGNGVPQKEDVVMELKPEGWEESFAAGMKFERLPGAQSAAVGSERLRSQQTAVAHRAAGHPAITGEERSIEAIMDALGETGTYDRVWVDPRLDMPFVKGVTPHFDRLLAAAEDPMKGYVREMLTLYNEAKANGENIASSMHATQVRNIASIIARYARVTPKLIDNPEAPKALERFLGTHGGIQESFWIELVRKMKGESDAEKVLELVPNGIAYNEGMVIDITASDSASDPDIHITFSLDKGTGEYTFDEKVPLSLIQELVRDFSKTL